MANKYIGDVTTSTPALTDFLVGVNGSDAYKTLVSDVAKKIIENYSGSTIGGSAQTIQNAFSGANEIIGANNITGYNNRRGWIALTSGQDLNTVTAPGVYYAAGAIVPSLLNLPGVLVGASVSIRLIVEKPISNGTDYRQTITLRSDAVLSNSLATDEVEIVRGTKDSGATWGSWELKPMRREINAITNRGGKNLLDNYQVSRTVNGVTLTRNADNSVTLNGTATAQTDFVSNYTIPTGSYIMTGTPQGGSDSTYYLAARVNGSWAASTRDYGDGARLNGAITSWAISIASGVTLDNVTFYPMIRESSIQDDTYVSYGMSNAELTGNIGTFTPSSDVTMTLTEVVRMGRMVFVRLYGTVSSAIGSSKTLGTISGVPLPGTRAARFLVTTGNRVDFTGQTGVGHSVINGQGVLSISAPNSTDTAFMVNAWYMA